VTKVAKVAKVPRETPKVTQKVSLSRDMMTRLASEAPRAAARREIKEGKVMIVRHVATMKSVLSGQIGHCAVRI